MNAKPDRNGFAPELNRSSGPLLIVLSGPSGVGKDAVLTRLKESGYPLCYITTLTTRPRRDNEKDMVDYHFVSTEEYRSMLAEDNFLESANVYGNWYGVPRAAVKEALDRGEDVIIKIDVQGAATIKKTVPEAVFIFLAPPSMEELNARLTQRLTESPADLALRLKTAKEEMKQLSRFDYMVVNQSGEIDRVVATIQAIITAEKCRVTPRRIALP
ncbi:MAG: guanylate kinase [Dehalococcoidales bacterium]|nr:MAG: guanylate kinase [Dehalococcoidales bacterium]